MERCDACGGDCQPGLADWHYECRACGTEHSTLRPSINSRTARIPVEEDVRVRGLATIRRAGYRRVLGELDRLRGAGGGTLLEVGSAYGWFLVMARDRFERTVGIEPDDAIRAHSAGGAIEVRPGYFPAAVRPQERFDVVAFNDVFEHIPGAPAAAAAVAAALLPHGVAIVNLPVSHGALYRAAKVLCRWGICGPFERMWQSHFQSPHLYYFSRRGLQKLFADAGLRCERVVTMPTLHVAGLWARIRCAEPNLLFALAAYGGALLMAPFVALLPPDVECFFFRKTTSVPGIR